MNHDVRTSTCSGVVLIAEDDELQRLMLSGVLSDAGFTVLTAKDGADALEQFAANSVDCVISDVNMPKVDGFGLCSMLRVLPGGERAQFLFITGQDDLQSIQRAYEVGANDFVTKGTHPALLVERVNFLLRSQQLQDHLRLSEQRLAYAQRLAQLGHWEYTPEGHTLTVAPVVTQILDLERDEQLSWQHLCAHSHPDDVPHMQLTLQRAIQHRKTFRLEHRYISARNATLVLRHQGELALNAHGQWLIRSTVQNVTETRAQEERIRFLAFHDPLTGLPNRESAQRKLRHAIEDAAHSNLHIAVCALWLDDFSRISGSLGQQASDEVLKTVSQRLRSQLRDSDHIAREFGGDDNLTGMVARGDGDKFICIIDQLQFGEAAQGIVKRLQRAIATPLQIGATRLQLTASVGISVYPTDGDNADDLLDCANSALRHVQGHKNACQFFASAISQHARERLHLESELHQAIAQRQFVMHYQPRLRLQDDAIQGAEALVRWQHPQRGLVMPGEFIPVLEEMNLIAELGQQVMAMVAQQTQVWRLRYAQPLRISFNISPLQFMGVDLLQQVDQAVQHAGAHYEDLEVEITESALLSQPDVVINTLHAFRERGLHIALDDFGTGFSSLSYLRKLPLDVLKIDRSFVSDIGVSQGGSALISAILYMADALDLKCVAEGVELETQLNFLRQHRCHEAQGYLLSRPLAVPDFERWLEHWQTSQLEQQTG